jgi:predicted nuclease of restriction endonuclease-like (RecB) superfamily
MDAVQKSEFAEVVQIIEKARQRVNRAVNTELIDLYWAVGKFVSGKIAADAWGKGTVHALASYVQLHQPGVRGFSAQNIWRMRQFYDAYRDQPKLSTMLRELPWSSNLHILTRAKLPEEREFYLRMATEQRWQVREVARQMDSQLFARAVLNPPKVSTSLRALHPEAGSFFKDRYFLEFLGLPQDHSEADLHRGLMVFFADSRVAAVLTQSRTMCTLLRCAPLRLALDKKSSSGECLYA